MAAGDVTYLSNCTNTKARCRLGFVAEQQRRTVAPVSSYLQETGFYLQAERRAAR